jgi:hypothetical protein
MHRVLATLGFAAAAVFGCGEDSFTVAGGTYARTTVGITEDACHLAMAVGTVEDAYGRVTATPTQITVTRTFTNEIYLRMGGSVTRSVRMDLPATGSCVLDDDLHEEGKINGTDAIDVTRVETHAVKSGDCTNVVGSMCRSSFEFKLSRTGP